ncbi:hypothetical protein EA462_16610 [Natrarchaeobius halalkaliphilus]|uniref:Uncharacterized protein n=1 Tax=Natrarchaeobius halalkaliphilus TaxID=1679091 RepID=A0A3N6NZ32_9EURY|nr:hypothetical protein [Natrarchaeobius halalkaliphilus]RQG86756.1 hypothetical protein EA462_16610 [Natrarchaeobius halalkaliphilus]
MEPVEILYAVFSVTLITSGLVMAGMAVQAYAETQRTSMIYLSIGFTLIVAAASATTISAFVSGFQHPRTLLTVNYFVTTLGFVAVILSLYAE